MVPKVSTAAPLSIILPEPFASSIATAADGVVGASSTPGRRWLWQTKAWSGNKVHPNAVLYQRIVSTASNPGPLVGGSEVDVNDVLAADCGQWNLHP